MKIALFTTSLSGTGVGRTMLSLAEGLYEKGYDIEFVLMHNTISFESKLFAKLSIVSLNARTPWHSFLPFLRYVYKSRPDVIISALDIPNFFAVICRRIMPFRLKAYITQGGIAGFVFGKRASVNHRLLQLIIRHSYQFADGVIAVSQNVAAHIKTANLAANNRIHVVYNGFSVNDIQKKAQEVCPRIFHGNEDVPIIIAVGRLNLDKDFATLLRAFALVRPVRICQLIIFGEGDQRPKLEALANSLGLRDCTAFPGFCTNVFPYMARASVFVLSSLREGFGNVIVEALACGTPVVCTDCPGGVKEILNYGRYGPLVPVGDEVALASAILTTLNSPTPPDVLRARAEFFSRDRFVEGYLAIIKGSTDAL